MNKKNKRQLCIVHYALSIVHCVECLNGEAVAVETKAGYHAQAGWSDSRVMALGLTFVDVAQVYLDCQCRYGAKGVGNSQALMAIGTGVNDNAINVKASALYLVDYLTLHIALEKSEFNVGISGGKQTHVVVKSLRAIDIGLALTCEV